MTEKEKPVVTLSRNQSKQEPLTPLLRAGVLPLRQPLPDRRGPRQAAAAAVGGTGRPAAADGGQAHVQGTLSCYVVSDPRLAVTAPTAACLTSTDPVHGL